VEGIPEVREGDDLGALLAAATRLEDDDVVVVAQKAVSKAEGRTVRLDEVEPSARARELAAGTDPRRLEVILREAERIVRARPPPSRRCVSWPARATARATSSTPP